eukprot:COSAG06_NODE_57294_length_281_cov_0.379121_1_plen_49_part_10
MQVAAGEASAVCLLRSFVPQRAAAAAAAAKPLTEGIRRPYALCHLLLLA